MPTRLRSVLYLLLAALATAALAACGGDDQANGKPASSSTDVDTLLRETFTGSKKVDSGRVALALALDAKGSKELDGPVSLKVSGPFQSRGAKQLPAFKLDLAFSGAGQDVRAGATSTGAKAFVNLNGTAYAVSGPLFRQFEAGYEQAQKEAADANGGKQTSLATLGIDPTKWLTNARNAGEAKVGDADTIKITGGVDVGKLLDDVNTALGRAASLGLQGSGKVPQKLTAQQRKEITDAVKSARVGIYTGQEDKILRRMVVAVDVVPPAGSTDDFTSAAVRLDLSITDVNEDQDIQAPSNAKPLDDLLGQFGGLGGLGSSGPSGSSGSSSAADQARLKRYTDCISSAGSDTAKARKCAELLTP
jgi:hypothetical protein